MKRKFSLVLAMVLAMTMVMGMSMTVYAATITPGAKATLYLEDLAPGTVIDVTGLTSLDNGVIIKRRNGESFKVAYTSNNLTFSEGSSRTEVPIFGAAFDSFTIAENSFYVMPPTPTPTPTPTPKKESKKEKEQKEGISYLEYLAMLAAKETDKEDAVEMKMRAVNAAVDKDTFKSEAPSKTVMSTDTMGADKFLDLKIHAADDTTKTNQNFLAQALVGTNVKILLTENIYSGRDLSISENGSLQTLTWNNLPKNQPGPVYAVVYNQIDGAYEINGILDANGTATFTGFKLRPASTITICK